MTSSDPYQTSREASAKVACLLMLWKTPCKVMLSAPCRAERFCSLMCFQTPSFPLGTSTICSITHFIQHFFWTTLQATYAVARHCCVQSFKSDQKALLTSKWAQQLGTTPSPSWPCPSPHTCGRSNQAVVVSTLIGQVICVQSI